MREGRQLFVLAFRWRCNWRASGPPQVKRLPLGASDSAHAPAQYGQHVPRLQHGAAAPKRAIGRQAQQCASLGEPLDNAFRGINMVSGCLAQQQSNRPVSGSIRA